MTDARALGGYCRRCGWLKGFLVDGPEGPECVDGCTAARLAQKAAEWRCDNCAATRWVGWRAGPAHHGFQRFAQCVPCGHVQNLPQSELPEHPEETTPMPNPSTEVQPFITAELIDDLPDPRDLTRVVKERIEAATLHFRQERGTVTDATQTYDLHRRLQSTREKCADYARGFKAADKLISDLQREELETAVGEQDGVPMAPLTVPTAGGDIHITPQFANDHKINPDELTAVIIKKIRVLHAGAMAAPDSISSDGARVGALIAAAGDAMEMLMTCGKFEPQVTKVKAAAAMLARAGDDALAGELLATIKTTRVFQEKVKVERKAPK